MNPHLRTACVPFLAAAFFSTTASAETQATSLTFLWIGNSFTFNGGEPGLTRDKINRGQTVYQTGDPKTSYAWNKSFKYQWSGVNINGQNPVDLIRQGGNTHVVLQDFCVDPYKKGGGTDGDYGPDSLKKYLPMFVTEVKNKSAIPLVFCIWPARNNQAVWDSLISLYKHVSDACGAQFVPASAVWKLCLAEQPSLGFWDPNDGFHPSALGGYACACAFYAVVTGKSPVGNPVTNNLDAATCLLVQQKAWLACQTYTKPVAAYRPGDFSLSANSGSVRARQPAFAVLLDGRTLAQRTGAFAAVILGNGVRAISR